MEPIEFRYFTRLNDDYMEAPLILREQSANRGTLQRWDGKVWESARDLLWMRRTDGVLLEIDRDEAMALTERSPAGRTAERRRQQKEDEIAQQRILKHMKDEQVASGMPIGLSKLHQSAVVLHEMFCTFMEAGFTEDQALKVVVGIALGASPTTPDVEDA